MSSKIFVLDTSAVMSLVQDVTTYRRRELPAFAGVLGDNEIVIPRVVLDELDGLKRDKGDRGKTAIASARQLEHYSNMGNLVDGIETEKGGVLRISPRPSSEKLVAWGLRAQIADHEILATTLELEDQLLSSKPEGESERQVILITQDRLLRVLARSVYGVKAEELISICAPDQNHEPGYMKLELDGDELDQAIEAGSYTPSETLPLNEFVHLVDKENPQVHYAYGMARDADSDQIEIVDRSGVDYLKVAGDVTGRNPQQKFLLWALMGCGEPDPMAPNGIRLITVSGPAGSGKSFLTLAAAWERLERGHFERIVITRPMVEVGTSMGYLPGTLEEKVRPWGGPIEDNLRAIVRMPGEEDSGKNMGGKNISGKRGVQRSVRPFDAKSWLEMENRLEIVPLTYIRGRTFRNSIVILEEGQNIERGPLKVLLTRLGEGSICVVIGDSSQIDNQFLSRRNNGLTHARTSFRNWPQAVHVKLKQIVRSDLAEAADRLM